MNTGVVQVSVDPEDSVIIRVTEEEMATLDEDLTDSESSDPESSSDESSCNCQMCINQRSCENCETYSDEDFAPGTSSSEADDSSGEPDGSDSSESSESDMEWNWAQELHFWDDWAQEFLLMEPIDPWNIWAPEVTTNNHFIN